MKCKKCGLELKSGQAVCPGCGKLHDLEPSKEEKEAVASAISGMPPDALDLLRDEFNKAMADGLSAKEFANSIMVGACPKCGSFDTGDCSEDPEINDICVGVCYQCGHYWCTECGKALDPKSPGCSCMDEG